MDEALGIDSGSALLQVSAAIYGTLILFWVVSPIGGYYLYKYLRLKIPTADLLALLAGVFCAFLISTAVVFLLIQRLDPALDGLLALSVGMLVGMVVTALLALGVVLVVRRGARRLPDAESFSVWGEDQHKRRKTYRRR